MAFVKIDKEILNSYCFANPNHLKVWIWLLVKANFKSAFCPLKIGKGYITVKVERGQLLFGRFKAEEELNLDGSMIYRILKGFEEQEQIKIESNNQYSLITICKYDTYQNNNTEDEQPKNNQRKTNKQPTESKRVADELDMNTSKEELEGIEEIEIKDGIPTKEEFMDYIKSVYTKSDKNFEDYKFSTELKYESWVLNGWKDGNGTKIKNWKSKANNIIPYLVANVKPTIKKANQPLF